jgi:hypothetical protein
MKKPKTKPAAKLIADLVTQTELRAVVELYDIANDLAIEIRRRIENGARVQGGSHKVTIGGGEAIVKERRHRTTCCGTSLRGLYIDYPEGAHA